MFQSCGGTGVRTTRSREQTLSPHPLFLGWTPLPTWLEHSLKSLKPFSHPTPGWGLGCPFPAEAGQQVTGSCRDLRPVLLSHRPFPPHL